MQTVELLEKADNQGKKIEVHCPFGCTVEDCTELGYCEHLVGFTNDGKMMDVLKPRLHLPKDGSKNYDAGEETGEKFVSGGVKNKFQQKVEKEDRIVNPMKYYQDGTPYNIWVSSRVYRKQPVAKVKA